MNLHTRAEAVKRANALHTNKPNTCQTWTRLLYGAPAAGDRDHDGDADAVDGWLSEPVAKRHTDRHPPVGVPVAYSGGKHGFGHRAISLGNGMIRSTDAGGSGKVATVSLDWPEKHWGLHYLGWSETIDGQPIPGERVPAPVMAMAAAAVDHHTRGPHVDAAIRELALAKGGGDRGQRIGAARVLLDGIAYLP